MMILRAARSLTHPYIWVFLAVIFMLPPSSGFGAGGVDSSWKPGIFQSLEYTYRGLIPFPKWTGALEKYFAERSDFDGGCQAATINRCHYRTWMVFLDSIRGADRLKQLERVNDFMNRHRYIVDPINWGVLDYWESPNEFFSKYGDCEDYAIAKFLSLRLLGWDSQLMRIVVLQDKNLSIPHAVLTVSHENQTLVLDNQIAMVVEADRIGHYQPIFSVNEESWWRHRPILY